MVADPGGDRPLNGKVALVTGGCGAIGMAIAEALVALGAAVTAFDKVDMDAGSDAEAAGAIAFEKVDLCDAEAVTKAIASIEKTHRRLDIIVNNAAEFDGANIVACSEDAWRRVLQTNIDGSFHVVRHGIPLMRASGGGAIVTVVSVAGLIGVPDRAAYAASKGALIAMTRQLARDFAADRIRVNAVAPAVVDGGPFHRSPQFLEDADRTRTGAMQAVPLTAALGRMIEPRDVADAVAFLVSPKATMITGVILPIDAGLTAI